MKIYCEIPDDVEEILKEFLLISKKDAQNIAQRMALYIAREARYRLLDQWCKLGREVHVDRGNGKEIARKEIAHRVDILEKFCREREGL